MALAPYLLLIAALHAATAAAQSPPPYANHTVGDAAGWFFNETAETPSANYSAWARPLTFNLGDYLIFNTNTNQTVVQTYNETSYLDCDAGDDSSDGDVSVYSAGEAFGLPAVLAVPLTRVGPNYYFSDADAGDQCQHGMKFQIVVNQGRGLPPSLNQPPPPPYVDPSQTPPASPAGVVPGQTPAPNGASPAGGFVRFALWVSLIFSAFLLH